jgi:ATP-binding cassette subfamily B protein
MNDFFRVLSYAGDKKPLMTKAIIALTISVLFSVAPFFIVSIVLNRFLGDAPPALWWMAAMAAAVFACLWLKHKLSGVGLDASHQLAYYTLAGMRRRVADKMLKMSMGDVQAYGTGAAKKNFVENIEEMELILAHAMPEGFANLFTFVIVILTMFIVDWRMALAALAAVILGFIPVIAMVSDGLKRMKPWYAAGEKMNGTIIEYISGMEVIKVFGQQSRSFKRYSDSVENYRQNTSLWYRSCFGYMTTYNIVMPAALLFMLPVGAFLSINGMIALPALVLSLLLGMSIGIPALRLINFIPMFPQLSYKSQKIEAMFDIPDMPDGTKPPPKSHNIVFDKVRFAYKEAQVIKNISLAIPENSVTALIGESGAGKSTLAKLLMRFWDIQEGAIKIGGVDIRNMPVDTLMQYISYVSQDNFLFNTSIMENIRYGKPEASDEEVFAMAAAAQCHEFIMETENGYNTIAGIGGDKLSGGQKQRLCIARALLQNAPVIILDEAMSFADPENEDKIQEALSKLIAGKTLIIIAHRLSTITDADNIVLLEHGAISDQGKHTELLSRSALYQKLWNAHTESLEWNIGENQNKEKQDV